MRQMLASKCFGGVLTDSFHAFFTEINWKKLKGVEYKEKDGTSRQVIEYKIVVGIYRPVLPLVVKYVNLTSQSPSLPLSFASACIDWIERIRSELSEEKSRRHRLFQTILDKARNAVEEAFGKILQKDDKKEPGGGNASYKLAR